MAHLIKICAEDLLYIFPIDTGIFSLSNWIKLITGKIQFKIIRTAPFPRGLYASSTIPFYLHISSKSFFKKMQSKNEKRARKFRN